MSAEQRIAELRAALAAASMMLTLVESKRLDFFRSWRPDTTEALALVRARVASALHQESAP